MIYFDHNASTPVRPEAVEAMGRALVDLHANPSSTHREGQRARAAVEHAREQVAGLVGAEARSVVFTSGGTEADHLSVVGAAWALEAAGRRIAISAIEHHAVHGAAELLERSGFHIDHLAVDRSGRVDPHAIDGLPPDTTLVAVMLANNETGVIQPVAELVARAHARGMRVQCDAVQAAGKIPVDRGRLGVDYLAISAHKLGGPKGIGALVVAEGAALEPLQRGSAHERGRRGGTENVPGIVGFGAAAAAVARELEGEHTRLAGLRERFERELAGALPDIVVHGRDAPRLPNTVNVSIPGARSDDMLMALDARGVAVSAGAACASGAVEPSPVLRAMGVPDPLAICAMRFSMGRTTSPDHVETVVGAIVDAARAVRGAGTRSGASA